LKLPIVTRGPSVQTKGDQLKLVTAKDYAAALWSCWLDSLDAIFRAGRLLLEAKERVPHGEWLDVIDGSPFSVPTAEKLMAIARHPLISNSSIRRILPPAWTTLYELSRLPDPVLDRAISDGAITPDLKEHQVRKLWGAEVNRPAPEYAIFPCSACAAHKLQRSDTRPSSLGEDANIQARLYDCGECGKTTLTEERVAGPFAKKTLPKSSHKPPVEGASTRDSGARQGQTGTE
jgi:hypothetical protein